MPLMDEAIFWSDWYCTCWTQYSFHIIWMVNVENVEKGPELQWESEGVLLSKFQKPVQISSVLLELKSHEVIIESFCTRRANQKRVHCAAWATWQSPSVAHPRRKHNDEPLICMQNTSVTCPKSQCAGGPGKSSKCRCDALFLTSRMANLYMTKTKNTEAISWQAADQPIDRNSTRVCTSAILDWRLRMCRWQNRGVFEIRPWWNLWAVTSATGTMGGIAWPDGPWLSTSSGVWGKV